MYLRETAAKMARATESESKMATQRFETRICSGMNIWLRVGTPVARSHGLKIKIRDRDAGLTTLEDLYVLQNFSA